MILQNMIKLFTMSGVGIKKPDGNQLSYNPTVYGVCNMLSQANPRTYQGSEGGTWLDVGFGDTPVTYEDYGLESSNKYDLLLNFASSQALARGSKDIINALSVFQNTSNANVVVREVGFFACVNNYSELVCLTRKVLDTPITIAPGESYSFNYIIRLKT